MPWTATFAANFEPFDRQLDQASASLGQFEQDTKKVERSLQRMVSEFDGTKVSQQAQSMAAAVDKIGGAAKLTEAEQRKLNATVTEAMAKYRALGTDAPASVQRLSRELQDASKAGGLLATTFGQVKTAALGAFAGFSAANLTASAIGGIKQIAGEAITLAGRTTDLANQAGVAASAFLRMSNAAELSGVSAEGLATQITKLTDRLISGETSAVGAVRALGLSMDDLLAMSADARYVAIVDALARVGDEAHQTKLAYDVFGDGAAAALKLVRDEFAETQRSAATWSDDQIRILAELGDRWDQFKQGAVSSIGTVMTQIATFGSYVQDFAEANYAAIASITGQGGGLLFTGAPKAPISPLAGRLGDGGIGLPTEAEIAAIIAASNKQADATRRVREDLVKLNETLLDQRGWDAHVAKLHEASAAYAALGVMSASAAQGLDAAARARAGGWQMGAQAALPSWTSGLPAGLGTPVATPGVNAPMPGPAGGPSWFNARQLPGVVVGAFQGGGNVGQALGGGIASSFFGSQAMTKMLSSGIFASAGGLLGSAVPVVGTLLGGLAGKFLGGLLGPSKNAQLTQQSNANIATTQAGLLKQYGSVAEIAKMGAAGDALAAAWGSKGQAGEQWFNQLVTAFERQNQLLDEQATKQATLKDLTAQRAALEQSLIPTAATVTGLMQQYGIEIEGAGQKVQQLVTTADFEKLINDMQTLERAGIDTGGMLSGMADEISGVVQRSLKFKTEIPENMRPYIESLAKAGRLTDENGEAITDLSGIKFGAPVETEAQKVAKAMDKITDAMQPVVDRLKEIADLLARGIPAAAQAGADGVDAAFRDAPTGSGSEDSRGYAAGDVVYGTRRAWIGEGGQPEIVGPVSFMARALAGAMAMQGGMAFAGAGFDARVAVPLYLHERELGRAIIDVTPKAARWAGVRLPRS